MPTSLAPQLIGLCHELGADLPLHTATAFLLIHSAGSNGMSSREIQSTMGLPNSTVGRILQRLRSGTDSKLVGVGLEVLEMFQDPLDARVSLYAVNAKGRGILKRLGL